MLVIAACGQSSEPISTPPLQPPVIEVISPTNAVETDKETIDITIEVKEASVSQLNIKPLNWTRLYNPTLTTGQQETLTIPLTLGINTIELMALNGEKPSEPIAITVNRVKTQQIDVPSLVVLSPTTNQPVTTESVPVRFVVVSPTQPTITLNVNNIEVDTTIEPDGDERWLGQAQAPLNVGSNDIKLFIQGFETQTTQTIVVERKNLDAPLELIAHLPNTQQDVESSQFTVRGLVTKGEGARSGTLSSNGQNQSVTIAADGHFTATIGPLKRGENTIELLLEDDKVRIEKTWTVYYGTRVSAGGAHTGAIAQGKVYTWGRNNKGQLGLGFTSTLAEDTHPQQPTALDTLNNVSSIAFSQNASLALTETGNVYAWGDNSDGQLGLGDAQTIEFDDTDRVAPEQIKDLSNVLAIVRGYNHSMVLKEDGTVWAFGQNRYGQLGDGTTNDRDTPTQVMGLQNIVQIRAGSASSFALDAQGQVWAWGRDRYANVGAGAASDDPITSPVKVIGPPPIAMIATGRDHVLALDFKGHLWGWGLNASTQLGDEAVYGDPVTSPKQLTWAENIGHVYANGNQSFVLREDARIYGWGQNLRGTLGTAAESDRATPGDPVFGLEGVTSAGIGALHGVARTLNGEVFTWGWSFEGSLGGGEGTINRWTYKIPIIVTFPSAE